MNDSDPMTDEDQLLKAHFIRPMADHILYIPQRHFEFDPLC